MKRVLAPVAVFVAVGVIFWLMVQNLQTEPVGRDDPAAIILRAPDGYVVDDLGSASLASAAGLLIQSSGAQVGKRFSEQVGLRSSQQGRDPQPMA